ncbi:Acetoin dehydrogenase operon transcriptional activator AcoR [Burkholderiales bacterium]|nr:Acetoin dehydrogenase operon transcriptional activator AcoR [Burkholderiales bacterium]
MVEMLPLRSPERMNNLRLQKARRSFFLEGGAPDALLSNTVLRSWDRCRASGLSPTARQFACDGMSAAQLREHRERNRGLLACAQSVMEYVFEQIRHSGSMVILSDGQGTILQTIGDADFVDRAGRVALRPGACWMEDRRGTNAIGTALVEERPVEIFGAEHFVERNTFLTCSATPLFDPRGDVIGVLDVSGDHRGYQSHTLGLASMAAQIIERRLFDSAQAHALRICFHPRAEVLGGPGEGVLALSPEGRILAINAAGMRLFGVQAKSFIDQHCSAVFELSLGSLVDVLRREPAAARPVDTLPAGRLYLRLSALPPAHVTLAEVVIDAAPRADDQTRGASLQSACKPAAPAASLRRPPGGDRLADLERAAIEQALADVGGNVSAAARRLGISRNTLYRKLGRL